VRACVRARGRARYAHIVLLCGIPPKTSDGRHSARDSRNVNPAIAIVSLQTLYEYTNVLHSSL